MADLQLPENDFYTWTTLMTAPIQIDFSGSWKQGPLAEIIFFGTAAYPPVEPMISMCL